MPGSPVAGIAPRAAPGTGPAGSLVVRGSLMTTPESLPPALSRAGVETRANCFHVEVTIQAERVPVS
jgi:hypothetical protein